jgi:hypothetical protein
VPQGIESADPADRQTIVNTMGDAR